MPDTQQGAIHSASEGGVLGKHPDPDPFEFLVAPATSSELNTARLRLLPVACFRIDDVRFKFDSSFVLPETQAEMKAFSDLRRSDPRVDGAPISIFGQADPSFQGNFEPGASTAHSGDEYNKTLSGRRAIAIYALLIRDAALWNNLFSNHFGGDVWGEDSIRIMLDRTDPQASSANDPNQGAADSARNAKVRSVANNAGQRQQLFLKYMDAVCGDLKLDKGKDFLAQGAGPDQKGDVQGCSRFNPLVLFSSEDEARFKQAFTDKDESTLRGDRDAKNGPNRRVMILIFRKGSQVLPSKWPCPTFKEGSAACKKRFFSDGDTRRSTHTPGADRKFEQTRNTFACRFYQRISTGAPCEQIADLRFIRIRFFDPFTVGMPETPYEITVSGQVFKTSADASGFVTLPVRGIPEYCEVRWGGPVSEQEDQEQSGDEFLYSVKIYLRMEGLDEQEEVKRRLHNLGYPYDESLDDNVKAFQTDYGLDPSGKPGDVINTLREWHDDPTLIQPRPESNSQGEGAKR